MDHLIKYNIELSILDNFPSEHTLLSLPLNTLLEFHFQSSIDPILEEFGESLKRKYDNILQIVVNRKERIIFISRLISNNEIDENIVLLERCAKDYDELATKLIREFGQKWKIKIDEDFPYFSFNKMRASYRATGKMKDWNYFLHGYHCQFVNRKTGQYIEASLVCGNEFGELDPYFFTKYINSTKEYRSNGLCFYNLYVDGERILNRMEELGIVKKSRRNFPGMEGHVLSYKDITCIKEFVP